MNDQNREDLWAASWMSKGEAPSVAAQIYWGDNMSGLIARGNEIRYRSPRPNAFGDSGRDYAMDRMLGWQAGGADVPAYGYWASPQTPFHAAPPYPQDGIVKPAPVPTSPAETPTQEPLVPARLLGDLLQLETQNGWALGALVNAVSGIAAEQKRQGERLEQIRAEFIAQAKALAPQLGILGRFFGR